MAKNKTTVTEVSVNDFIESFVESEQKKKDAYYLIELMEKISGYQPKMWGPSIIGFGRYHYKYASGHEGDAPLIGFSPRKSSLSLYVYTGMDEHRDLLEGLGKFKMGKVCIYANKMSDINEDVLVNLIKETLAYMKQNYEVD